MASSGGSTHRTETGSLSRIKRGLYLTVPHKSSFVDVSPVEPWVIAENLFRPCYIGGLSAAAYWGLTDSTVQTNMVLTRVMLESCVRRVN